MDQQTQSRRAEELGLRVCVVEYQHQFILHHQVMQKATDDAIAVSIVKQTKHRFDTLQSLSMDKGFHSKDNQVKLKGIVDLVVLPKRGGLSAIDKARQSDAEFVRLRRQHSALEAAINALESHDLDVFPDHGIMGFSRYVALAVVARNIQRLGAVLRQQEAGRIRGPCKKRQPDLVSRSLSAAIDVAAEIGSSNVCLKFWQLGSGF